MQTPFIVWALVKQIEYTSMFHNANKTYSYGLVNLEKLQDTSESSVLKCTDKYSELRKWYEWTIKYSP